MKHRTRYFRLLVAAAAALPALGLLAVPAGADSGSIDLIAPWGNAAYDSSVPLITVTYAVNASPGIPLSAIHGVQAGIDHWNNCLLAGDNSFSENLGSDTFTTTDSGCSSLSFKGDWHFVPAGAGTRPLVKISIKKGGGKIAGQTRFSSSAGFITGATVQISGSSFGSRNSAQVVWDIAAHELGHVVGLGHSDVSTDIMYPIINGTVSFGSCEINGAEALYSSWLPHGDPPALPGVSSVAC